MFYNHEILTSREGGLATVWQVFFTCRDDLVLTPLRLVATVGSKSHTKKLSRKAILNVNVPRTCYRIINPEAPMALRLQSNLLYGVSRVFSHQSNYLLTDAQEAQANMRALLKAVRTSELDPNAGKARPEQLVLADDPAFAANLYMQGLDLTDTTFAMSTSDSSYQSSILSTKSLASSQSSRHSGQQSIPIIQIPSSAGSIEGFGVFQPASDRGSSVQRSDRVERLLNEDAADIMIDDPGFSFDAEGNLIEDSRDADIKDVAAVKLPGEVERHVNLSGNAIKGASLANRDNDPFHNDDDLVLPDAEPSPATEGANAAPQEHTTSSSTDAFQDAADTGRATLRPRIARPRALPFDHNTQLRSAELADWRDNYVNHMQDAVAKTQIHRVTQLAKKTAARRVFGAGIGDVGSTVGISRITTPLSMFAGDGLMEMLIGTQRVKGSKHRHAELSGDEGDDEAEDQVGRGNVMDLADDDLPIHLDSDIEIGRRAETPLADDPTFPWNTTASAMASRQGSSVARSIGPAGFPSSVGGKPSSIASGRPGLIDQPARRLRSVSPLTRRAGQRFSSLDIGAGGDQDELGPGAPSSDGHEPFINAAESFELHGPGAGVSTQVQAGSQWMQATLDREAHNFFDFLKEEIAKLPATQEQRVEATRTDGDELAEASKTLPSKKVVEFEQLLPPAQHSTIVAAQALLHVLALATKDLVEVEQEEGFGTIKLGVAEEVST